MAHRWPGNEKKVLSKKHLCYISHIVIVIYEGGNTIEEGIRKELFSQIGAAFVAARHQALGDISDIISGKTQDRISCSIAEKIEELSPQQREAVDNLVMEGVDAALTYFLTILEENEALDLTISKNDKNYSIREVSDDLGAAYYGFVEEHSQLQPITRTVDDVLSPRR